MIIDTHNTLQFDPAQFVGERVFIAGTSGTGKSNTAGRLLEQLLPHFPFTVIDPDGDYFGLREKFPMLLVGDTAEADLSVLVEQAQAIAELSFEKSISVILDFSETVHETMLEFLLAYVKQLWQMSQARDSRKAYGLLVEEAPVFIPQGKGNPAVKNMFATIATRGRKRGICTIIVAQRPVNVDKDIVTQARWFFLHQVIFPNDVAVYKEMIPLPGSEVEPIIAGLNVGQCVFRLDRRIEVVTIARRETFHAGHTPGLTAAPVRSQKIDGKLLAQLRSFKPTLNGKPNGKSPVSTDTIITMREQIVSMRRSIDDLNRRVDELQQQLSGGNEKKSPPPTVEPKISAGNSKLRDAAAIQAQRFNSLLREISPAHRSMLVYLWRNPRKFYTPDQLAARHGYDRQEYIKRPPRELLDSGLIVVATQNRKRFYRAGDASSLSGCFPDLPVNNLISALEKL
jgi:hypothetical protein